MPKDKFWREKARGPDTPWAVPKRLPLFLNCPRCGKEGVRIEVDSATQKIRAVCGFCHLSELLDYRGPAFSSLDYYCEFEDHYYRRVRAQETAETRSGLKKQQ